MNPDRIYSNHRDDALAHKIGAAEYTTFVAMPFADSFSYRYKQVLDEIVRAAAKRATQLKLGRRPFAIPQIVSDGTPGAIAISDKIVEDILYSHLFVGDMTFNNPGAILEVGIAMGLKSNKQIILVTQGKFEDLHFDIRNNNVFSYNGANAVEELAQRFGTAALSFEEDADRQIRFIQRRISPDATSLLNSYGQLQRKDSVARFTSGSHRTFCMAIDKESALMQPRGNCSPIASSKPNGRRKHSRVETHLVCTPHHLAGFSSLNCGQNSRNRAHPKNDHTLS